MRYLTFRPPHRLRDHLPLLIALALAVAAVWPAMTVEGLQATHAGGDSPFLLQRVHAMAGALAARHIPPRWMPDAAYGLGYPFWNYYAPLGYILAGLVALLGGGVVGAIKVTQLAAFVLAAAGMYCLAAAVWDSRAAGLVAAFAYTFAPYHLVNVYVRGDALAELVAYAVFPWLLLTVDRVRDAPSPDAIAGLALAVAALLTSHNISALLFLPLAAVYLLWRLLPPPALRRVAARWQGPDAGSVGEPAQADPRPPWRRPPPRAVPARQLVVVQRWWTAPAAWTRRAMLVLEHRLWPWRRIRRGRSVGALALGLALGVALAAWFWAPALLERDQVQLGENLTGYFHYANHFRGLDLVRPEVAFDYSMGDAGCGPCRMGLVQLAVALLGLAAGLRLAGRRGELAFWFLVAGVTTFMITPLSEPLWARLPLLAYAQFPWRWLAVQALALAMLSAPLGRLPLRWPVSLLAGAALAASVMAQLPVETLAVAGVTREDITAFEVFSGNIGTTVRAEYLPRAVVPRPMSGPAAIFGRAGNPRAVSGFLDGSTILRRQAVSQEWHLQVAPDVTTTVAFPILAFPGWTASVDGGPPLLPETVPGSGYLAVEVPPGGHNVALQLGRSNVRAIAEGVAAVALLVAMLLLTANRRRSWRRLVAGGLLLLVGAVGLARLMPVGRAEGPVTLDYTRTPYPHYNPDGIQYGQSRLVAAGLKRGAVTAGETIQLNLTWDEPWAGWQVEAALVTPAEPVFAAAGISVPDVRARAERGQDQEMALVLDVPPEVPTGMYFLRLRVLKNGEPIPPQSAEGHDLGEVYLGPVSIRGKGTFREEPEPPVARMGNVRLLAVQPVQEGGALEVRLFWQADRVLAVNYKTSVRLLDAEGEVLVQEDKQPLYGFLPTTAWQPGEQVLDKRWLSLPENISPGDTYMVEVILYEEHSANVVGSGRVSGVRIERW